MKMPICPFFQAECYQEKCMAYRGTKIGTFGATEAWLPSGMQIGEPQFIETGVKIEYKEPHCKVIGVDLPMIKEEK